MSRCFYPSRNFGLGRVYAEFSFLANGASDPVFTTLDGTSDCVASITHSATGILLVTLKDAWNKVITAMADPDDTVNDGAYCTCSDIANEGTSTPITFKIRCRTAGGVLADLAANRKISVNLALRDSNQGGK